jgi:hypothetical protein
MKPIDGLPLRIYHPNTVLADRFHTGELNPIVGGQLNGHGTNCKDSEFRWHVGYPADSSVERYRASRFIDGDREYLIYFHEEVTSRLEFLLEQNVKLALSGR